MGVWLTLFANCSGYLISYVISVFHFHFLFSFRKFAYILCKYQQTNKQKSHTSSIISKFDQSKEEILIHLPHSEYSKDRSLISFDTDHRPYLSWITKKKEPKPCLIKSLLGFHFWGSFKICEMVMEVL